MEEDSYSSSASPSETPTDDKSMEEKDGGDTTALVPKSVLGEKWKPGDEVVIKIVHDYGDDYEFTYAPEKPSKSNDSEKDQAGMRMNDYAE